MESVGIVADDDGENENLIVNIGDGVDMRSIADSKKWTRKGLKIGGLVGGIEGFICGSSVTVFFVELSSIGYFHHGLTDSEIEKQINEAWLWGVAITGAMVLAGAVVGGVTGAVTGRVMKGRAGSGAVVPITSAVGSFIGIIFIRAMVNVCIGQDFFEAILETVVEFPSFLMFLAKSITS